VPDVARGRKKINFEEKIKISKKKLEFKKINFKKIYFLTQL